MGFSCLATAGKRVARIFASLLALAVAASLPAAAHAHPELTGHLSSQDGLMAVTGVSGAASPHRRLDVGAAEVTQTAGPLRYGITMEYGTVIDLNPNDYIGHEADHRSLRIDREVFAGATASLRVHKGWRLVGTAGRVQLRMHDSLGDMSRRGTLNEGTLMGWRMMAGLQHPLGAGLMTLGWQTTHYTGQQCSDPAQPTRGSAGHVALEIVSPL